MILFDPDLGPDADAVQSSAAGSVLTPRGLRLPSLRVLSRFLAEAKAVVGLRGQVTVLLTSDSAMRRFNRRFRGKNKATDVLSFPTEPLQNAKPAERVAGDLAISIPTARRQAAEQGHTLSTEIKVLILHGLLHLAGYDHETDQGRMARRERLLRGKLGLPMGLIERVEMPTLAIEKGRKNGAANSVPQVRRKDKNAPTLVHPASVGKPNARSRKP
jgi:probable rRNA maturation factor